MRERRPGSIERKAGRHCITTSNVQRVSDSRLSSKCSFLEIFHNNSITLRKYFTQHGTYLKRPSAMLPLSTFVTKMPLSPGKKGSFTPSATSNPRALRSISSCEESSIPFTMFNTDFSFSAQR